MKSTIRQSFRVNDSHVILSQFGITVTETEEGDTLEISGFDEESLRMGIYNYIVDLERSTPKEHAAEWLEDIIFRSAMALKKLEPNSTLIKKLEEINSQDKE